MKHIAFIGDSYCASYNKDRPNLSWISPGEIVGTKEETDQQFGHCQRANHMNPYNNQQLAQIIIDVLEQPWQPGLRALPMSQFDHPNAVNWYEPKGMYWTRRRS